MGFASRSVSITRYRVRGEIEGSFWDTVHEGIRKYSFRPVDTSGDEEAMGWTSMYDFTDIEFKGAPYVTGNYVGLALRVDTVRVPPRILEMNLKQETRKLLEETGKRRLSSGQIRDLRERLKESLRKQVFPSIQVFDLIWDTAAAVVYFGSHSVKARERVEDHFKKTFGLNLTPLLPYIRGEEILAQPGERQLLEQLRPSSTAP